MLPELELIYGVLEELHAHIERNLQEMDAEGLNWRPAPNLNSIYAIATHVAGSQTWWAVERIGDQHVGRDRPAEFEAAGDDPQEPIRRLAEAMRRTRLVFESLTKDSMTELRPGIGDRPATVRWIALHLIEHAALHLGHIQITRQWWEMTREER
jgi:hypothetical protein